MTLLKNIRERMANFERKDLFRVCLIYLGLCVAVVVAIVVRHIYVQQNLMSQIVQLNKARATVQEILSKYQLVQQQKNKVAAALQQNKGFNIQQFAQNVLQKYNIMAGKLNYKHQQLSNGYAQESLVLPLQNIDTKTLCEILLDIEQQDLVYTSSVDITKSSAAKKINASVAIATLKPAE